MCSANQVGNSCGNGTVVASTVCPDRKVLNWCCCIHQDAADNVRAADADYTDTICLSYGDRIFNK